MDWKVAKEISNSLFYQSWLHEVTPKKDGKVDEDTPPKSAAPMSKGLLIHIHGGGFVAHTSKSHEV